MDPKDWGKQLKDRFMGSDKDVQTHPTLDTDFGTVPKGRADYYEPGDEGFNSDHERCRDCVHFQGPDACAVVTDPVEPDAYCGEFFADVIVAAHEHPEGVEINFMRYGGHFDWEMGDVENFVLELRERLQNHLRRE